MIYDARRVEELIARWENGERDAEMRKVRNEVFDVLTLRTIYKLMEQGHISALLRVISTGKEANVFLARDSYDNLLAVKIYRVETSEFRHMWKYLDGDPRFTRVRKDRRHMTYVWARKEFKNLEVLHKNGVPVPFPVVVRNNVLVLEYIGDEEGPAPRLKDYLPRDPRAFADELIDAAGKMYFRANIVHADLSEYNILVHHDSPVIIDLAQGVPWEHPHSLEFFRRDLNRLQKILSMLGFEYTTSQILSMLQERKGNA